MHINLRAIIECEIELIIFNMKLICFSFVFYNKRYQNLFCLLVFLYFIFIQMRFWFYCCCYVSSVICCKLYQESFFQKQDNSEFLFSFSFSLKIICRWILSYLITESVLPLYFSSLFFLLNVLFIFKLR